MAQNQTSNYTEQGGARDVIGGSLDVISGGEADFESGSALKIAGTDKTTALSEVVARSDRLVAAGASLTLTAATHDQKTILFDQATGSALTLPAATGTGTRFRCVVSVTVTSNNHTIACVGTDEFAGHCIQTDTDTSDTLASYPALAADNFDTVTMNGTTTGGLIGDVWELEDVASGVWAIKGLINASGTVATPFSSAV